MSEDKLTFDLGYSHAWIVWLTGLAQNHLQKSELLKFGKDKPQFRKKKKVQ